MPRRLLLGLAGWTLVAGYVCASGEAPLPSSQNVTSQTVRPMGDGPHTSPSVPPEAPVDRQMQGFERHARVDMILYTGRFGQGDLAIRAQQLEVVALTLKGGSR